MSKKLTQQLYLPIKELNEQSLIANESNNKKFNILSYIDSSAMKLYKTERSEEL